MTLDKVLNVYRQVSNKDNVYHALKDLDIHIYYQIMKEPSKLFSYLDYVSVILRNGLEHEEYYMLHELGHFLLHKDIVNSAYGYGNAEFEANIFACVYLIHGNIYDEYNSSSLLSKGVPPRDVSRFIDTVFQYTLVHRKDDIWEDGQ